MEQIGVVKEIKGDIAVVEVNRISGCGGGCKTCGGCDTPAISMDLKNTINAKIGDTVKVQGNTKNLLKYTAIAYLIPLIMFFVSTVVSNQIFKSTGVEMYDLYSFLVGLIFIGISYLIIRKIDNDITTRGDNPVRIIEILETV